MSFREFLGRFFGKTKPLPAVAPAVAASPVVVAQPVQAPAAPAIAAAVKQPPVQPGFLEESEQARRLLAIALSRQATKFVTTATIGRVALSEEQLRENIKSKIIGKEGRNVRHFQERTGVDLILNDEPDAVLVSSFDPFRREVARVALEILVKDGRIQAAKIEEAVADAKKRVDADAREAGARAFRDLGLETAPVAITRVLGTLKFRASFGQNQLDHSIETAWIAGNLASELGFDVQLARRAGLLHDLGKALDQTHDGGHAQAGATFARKHGESAAIVRAIESHHEELAPESWLDHLVLAADALSGARPGARSGSIETAATRMRKMEELALTYAGVTEAYAVQAGRELRVFVDCNQVGDDAAREVARGLARGIESEMRFPGQIKVTVLRELRATEVAQR